MPDTRLPPSARAIRLHPADTVVIALEDLAPGTELAEIGRAVVDAIPRGHKIAAQPIAAGAQVIRYGQIIGTATADIAPGAHVHSHNLGMGDHAADYAFASEVRPLPAPAAARTFQGYNPDDGKVGTRHYLGILTSGNCS
ncbi:MAG: altronate dehydratase, partial [Rubellimicrobium sp.]|nr:altronate dehydratase [Rubellimicrobium sp.]